MRQSGTTNCFGEAFLELVADADPAVVTYLASVTTRLKAQDITGRVVEAAVWLADNPVLELEVGEEVKPVVLVGDALCGKPFYTGSTLNHHFADVAEMVQSCEIRTQLSCDSFLSWRTKFAMRKQRVLS